MSDADQVEGATEGTAPTPSTIISVPVIKGKGTIDIDTSMLPDDVYREALLQGLKVLANRGTSKVTKTTYPKEDELKAKAMEVAEAQRQAMYDGKIKLTGGSSKASGKVTGAVKTEAMRLARNLVKDELKRQKIKISHVAASDITAAAKALLEQDDSLIEQAKANLAEREKVPVSEKINVAALVKVDPKKVAASEAKAAKAKAEKGEGLSAKQAGMVAKRAKGEARATTH